MNNKFPLVNILVGVFLIILGFTPYHNIVRSGVTFVVAPMSYGFYSLAQKSTKEINFWKNLRTLSQENLLLTQEVYDLKSVKTTLYEMQRENELLKKELALKNTPPNKTSLIARVTGRDLQSGTLSKGFFIDKGRNYNVAEGDVVVLHGALIGKIVESRNTVSVCQIVTDAGFVTSAVTQQSRIIGLVSGKYGTKLAMEHILQSETPLKGEPVITTGQDGKFPAGLLLGYVEEVQATASAVQKVATITPALQFNNIEQVIIWKNE